MGRIFYDFLRGDFISLRYEICTAVVYHDSQPFEYSAYAFTATSNDTGIVLARLSENNISILYHYIRVLFSNGKIGVTISDNLKVVQSFWSVT